MLVPMALPSDIERTESPVGQIITEALERDGNQTAEQVLKLVTELHVEQQNLAERGARLAAMIRASVDAFADEVRHHAERQRHLAGLFDGEMDKLKTSFEQRSETKQ